MKRQSLADLETSMRAVARGERRAPKDAREPSVESAAALLRLLTPENRVLLSTIRDRKPQSVSELAKMTARAEPNVLRTLGKLEAMGFVRLRTVARRRVPEVTIKKLRLEIDPFSSSDSIWVVGVAR
ncbi:MAG TPA: MarR family transcriptional regulator [Alphaproteobacteria bacterium]|nr:MarR family transcriptional regulator [Alphaproteobacteria bacterium]HAJ47531.1 MarR family transcriptional regulator [Alphaproteobacteria bacterium]